MDETQGFHLANAAAQGALEDLSRAVQAFFGERLASVVAYGSIVFDDLAPGYGDLDFVVVMEGNLREGEARRLAELRRPFRAESASIYSRMLEGAFLPRHMLDPAREGKGFWWGTSGEREWPRNELGWLVLEFIRTRGVVIAGRDVRGEIPAAGREQIGLDMRKFCADAREQGKPGTPHCVDWLLSAARLLVLVREGRFSSKSEAADWGLAKAHGAWREQLPRAKTLRLNPARADDGDVRTWLATLKPSIDEAADELEREINRAGF